MRETMRKALAVLCCVVSFGLVFTGCRWAGETYALPAFTGVEAGETIPPVVSPETPATGRVVLAEVFTFDE